CPRSACRAASPPWPAAATRHAGSSRHRGARMAEGRPPHRLSSRWRCSSLAAPSPRGCCYRSATGSSARPPGTGSDLLNVSPDHEALPRSAPWRTSLASPTVTPVLLMSAPAPTPVLPVGGPGPFCPRLLQLRHTARILGAETLLDGPPLLPSLSVHACGVAVRDRVSSGGRLHAGAPVRAGRCAATDGTALARPRRCGRRRRGAPRWRHCYPGDGAAGAGALPGAGAA